MIEDPKDDEAVTPYMDIYKAKIQSDGSLDKLKLRIVVRGDLQNKDKFPISYQNLKNFAEVTKLSENIRKPWLKTALKEIKNLINNQNFMIEDPKDGEPVNPCMDAYPDFHQIGFLLYKHPCME